ncbi:hypothetical protein U1Q18_040720, partial [Sarracenia purpurea var. burkii]
GMLAPLDRRPEAEEKKSKGSAASSQRQASKPEVPLVDIRSEAILGDTLEPLKSVHIPVIEETNSMKPGSDSVSISNLEGEGVSEDEKSEGEVHPITSTVPNEVRKMESGSNEGQDSDKVDAKVEDGKSEVEDPDGGVAILGSPPLRRTMSVVVSGTETVKGPDFEEDVTYSEVVGSVEDGIETEDAVPCLDAKLGKPNQVLVEIPHMLGVYSDSGAIREGQVDAGNKVNGSTHQPIFQSQGAVLSGARVMPPAVGQTGQTVGQATSQSFFPSKTIGAEREQITSSPTIDAGSSSVTTASSSSPTTSLPSPTAFETEISKIAESEPSFASFRDAPATGTDCLSSFPSTLVKRTGIASSLATVPIDPRYVDSGLVWALVAESWGFFRFHALSLVPNLFWPGYYMIDEVAYV